MSKLTVSQPRPFALAATLLLLSLPAGLSSQDVPEFNPEAVRAFADGSESYIGGEYEEALTHYYRAYELDPTFIVALYEAAVVHGNRGEGQKRDSLVRVVAQHSERLSPYYRHRLRTTQAQIAGDLETGYQESRKAAELAPGTKAVYNQGIYGMWANHPREARDALLSLDPEKPPMKGWYSYFTILTWAEHELGEHEAELRTARKAAALYPGDMGPVLLQAEALAAMGRTSELTALFDHAASLPPRGALTLGVVMSTAAADLDAHGHGAESGPVYERALAWFEGRPADEAEGASHRSWHAWTLRHSGRLEEARERYRSMVSDAPDNLQLHGNLGILAAELGDRDGAMEHFRWLQEVDDARRRAGADLWRGYIAAALGERDLAVRLLRLSFDGGQAHFRWLHRDEALNGLRGYGPFEVVVRPRG